MHRLIHEETAVIIMSIKGLCNPLMSEMLSRCFEVTHWAFLKINTQLDSKRLT